MNQTKPDAGKWSFKWMTYVYGRPKYAIQNPGGEIKAVSECENNAQQIVSALNDVEAMRAFVANPDNHHTGCMARYIYDGIEKCNCPIKKLLTHPTQ